MAEQAEFRWLVLPRSVPGTAHRRTETPNQDAFLFKTGEDGRAPIVLAVSDGHGSPKSFRSDLGAKLAVEIAVETTWTFQHDSISLPDVKRDAEHRLPAEIVKEWRRRTAEDAERNPFKPEELERLEREAGPAARKTVEDRPEFAYGATLLLVAVADRYLFYLQLGDGEILEVSDKTQTVERPLPADETLIANETTSLCMENAARLFRFRFQATSSLPPALILLTTDGYPNSFASAADFDKVGADLLEMVQEPGGWSKIERDLETWLIEASNQGSGDDATLGIVCRQDLIKQVEPETTSDQNQEEIGGPAT